MHNIMATKGLQALFSACSDVYDPASKELIGELREVADYFRTDNITANGC